MKQSRGIVYYLEEVRKIVEKLSERNLGFGAENNLIAYRGEAMDYGDTKLMPSIFRNQKHLENESKLFEFLYDFGIIDNSVKKNIDKAIESQHYLAISRLLDISFNVLSAFYFSCTNVQDKDGFVYVFCFPEHYSPHSSFIEKFYSSILQRENSIVPYSNNFKVISHSHCNERIRAQGGGFIFFPGDIFKQVDEIYFDRIRIATTDKKKIVEELKLIFNVYESTIYPEKDKFAPLIKERIEKNYYSEKEITIKDEIHSCFERLNFEIEVLVNSSTTYDRKNLLRRIRKEEADLEEYIDSSPIETEEKLLCIKENKRNFELLKILI